MSPIRELSWQTTVVLIDLLWGCSIYFNPIGGRPGVISPQGVDIDASEFPAEWFEGLEDDMYKARRYVADRNKYKVAFLLMSIIWAYFDKQARKRRCYWQAS